MPQFDDRDGVCLQTMNVLARTWMEQMLHPDQGAGPRYDADAHFRSVMPSPTVFAQYAYDMFHAAMSEKERERVQVVEGAKMSAFAPPRK
jgi:hypothetical protein